MPKLWQTPDDIELTVNGSTVTIKGEMKTEAERKDRDYLIRERRTGTYQRAFSLPTVIDADHTEAYFTDGVLTVTLPKRESTKPKRIPFGT